MKTISIVFSMTKPMPTGCIKKRAAFLVKFSHLETVDLDDLIGCLCIVHIFFDEKALPESNCSTMKFFHQLLTQTKDLHIIFMNYLIKIKINQNHIDVLLNLMPLCFQKTLFQNFFEQSRFKRDFVLNNQQMR